MFPSFAKEIFGSISLALPSNMETVKYLKQLNVKNIKVAGNLKYCGNKNEHQLNIKILKNKFKKFKIWCAASTHNKEESVIGKLHKKLKKKHKQLITVIIPRHINRSIEIIEDLKELGLNVITHSSNQKPKNDTDIYLVDSYGISSNFYDLSNVTFVGGSLIPHGGQNPLEPARYGNTIISGPYIHNFKEIYSFLSNKKISIITSDIIKIEEIIIKKLSKKINSQKIKIINQIGKRILDKNMFYINKYIK